MSQKADYVRTYLRIAAEANNRAQATFLVLRTLAKAGNDDPYVLDRVLADFRAQNDVINEILTGLLPDMLETGEIMDESDEAPASVLYDEFQGRKVAQGSHDHRVRVDQRDYSTILGTGM